MKDENYQFIKLKTIEYLKEIIINQTLDRDPSEEYELAISICYELSIPIVSIDKVLVPMRKLILNYCRIHNIKVLKY